MQAGYYRPMYYHAIKAGLDASGNVIAWQHRIVGQSILTGTPFEAFMVKNGVDGTSVEGASTLPYAIPNLQVDLHTPKVGVPVHVVALGRLDAYRVLDRDLHRRAGGRRRQGSGRVSQGLLAGHPRHLGVLELAADKAGWGTPLAPGKTGEKRGAASRCTSRSTPLSRRSPKSRSARRQLQRRSRRLRRRLRHRRQPRRDPRPDGGRHRLRPVRGAARRDHAQGRRRRTDRIFTSTRRCASTKCRRWRSISWHRMKNRQASASLERRSSPRRSPTRSPPRQESACECCRWHLANSMRKSDCTD